MYVTAKNGWERPPTTSGNRHVRPYPHHDEAAHRLTSCHRTVAQGCWWNVWRVAGMKFGPSRRAGQQAQLAVSGRSARPRRRCSLW